MKKGDHTHLGDLSYSLRAMDSNMSKDRGFKCECIQINQFVFDNPKFLVLRNKRSFYYK